MRLNSDNTIVTSSDSNLKLTVFSSNYYLRETDEVLFVVSFMVDDGRHATHYLIASIC